MSLKELNLIAMLGGIDDIDGWSQKPWWAGIALIT